jgi:RNA polymerase sigma-70 factor (ECF subfamily)
VNAIRINGETDTGGPSKSFFEDVVALYQGTLFQFALTLTRCEADAWDLTQQTFYTLAAKGHQLRDASRIKTWMFTTLHRAFLQICRKNSRFPQLELDEADSELPNILPSALDRLDSAQVVEALDQINEVYRVPLILFYLEEHSYKQIADALTLPIGTVKSRIARGISQLRKSLSTNFTPELA